MEQQPKIRITPYHVAFVPIDGFAIEIRIKRLERQEQTALETGFHRAQAHEWLRRISTRLPGDEQEQRDGAFVIPDATIHERRLAEMTEPERARFERWRDDTNAETNAFITDTISRYVRVAPGQIEIEEAGEAREITEGADLVRFYGSRLDVLLPVIEAVLVENSLSPSLKNAYRSGTGSRSSSAAPDSQEASGARPEPPVTNADAAPSATSGAATASIEDSPSGATTPGSTSAPVLCGS